MPTTDRQLYCNRDVNYALCTTECANFRCCDCINLTEYGLPPEVGPSLVGVMDKLPCHKVHA